jgi:hypothetical protein
MRLESHIGDVICDWSHKYVTGDAICDQRRNYVTALVASSLGDMLIRIAYIADHLGLISLSPLMYYFTFMQATKQPSNQIHSHSHKR